MSAGEKGAKGVGSRDVVDDAEVVCVEESVRNDGNGCSVEADELDCLGSPELSMRSEKDVLRREVRGDESLSQRRELADRDANGYKWEDDLVFHEMTDTSGDKLCRLVLPVERRAKVMELAHDKSGHVGAKAMRKLINRNFTWPGMSVDLVKYERECNECLRHNKAGNKAAKMVERPVITVPFKSVAFDLVGPLPKGRGRGKVCAHLHMHGESLAGSYGVEVSDC